MTRELSVGEGSGVNQNGPCFLCSSTLTLSIKVFHPIDVANFSLSEFGYFSTCF